MTTVSYTDDCYYSDDEDCPDDQQPFSAEGVSYLPGDNVRVGVLQDANGAHFVCVMISNGPVGISNQWLPDGARQLAASLMRSADEADAAVAEIATAMLNDIRKGGRP